MEPPHPLLGKTTRALAVMAVALAVPYASPSLRRLRVAEVPWDRSSDATDATDATRGVAPKEAAPTVGEATLHASENAGGVTNALPDTPAEEPELDPQILARTAGSLAIEDPTGHAMDAFYTQLARTEACHGKAGDDAGAPRDEGLGAGGALAAGSADPAGGGADRAADASAREDDCRSAVTRVLHYGDSVITSDLVSGTLRRQMQSRFGDAGHGFILAANAWEWYFHNDVAHTASDAWAMSRITGPLSGDGIYGLGGVSFHTADVASAWFSTASKGDYGRRVSRFDIYYEEQPAGGDVDVIVPGRPAEIFSTRGGKKASRVRSVAVADGPAQMTIRTRGSGDVRLFGVALERDVPGVVYDALGANGARARLWSSMSVEHWTEQMALRKPSLIVLQYGTNESEEGKVVPEVYTRQLGDLVDKVRRAAPDASVLVAAPLDRAERGDGGKMRTRAIIPQLVDLQRQTAAAHGAAFWNTYEAMGGEGSFARWVKAEPQLASWDLTHPTPAGAEVIGDLFFKALTTGLSAFQSRGPHATK